MNLQVERLTALLEVTLSPKMAFNPYIPTPETLKS